jgi:hypothetical protein
MTFLANGRNRVLWQSDGVWGVCCVRGFTYERRPLRRDRGFTPRRSSCVWVCCWFVVVVVEEQQRQLSHTTYAVYDLKDVGLAVVDQSE